VKISVLVVDYLLGYYIDLFN